MKILEVNSLVSRENEPLEQLHLLTSLLHEFSSSIDLETTLKHTTQLIKKHLNAEGVSLFFLDNDDKELVCRICTSEPDITGIRLKASKGIIGRTLRENTTQIVRDAARDPDFFNGVDEKSGTTTKSVLCSPLQIKNHKFGALEVINKISEDGLFNSQDRDLLSVLANAAAMAIYNARLVEELLEQERIKRDLELARIIQTALLPDNIENQMIFGINIPARELSGDFYDYFQIADGRIIFNLGDVAGKGANAALLMAKTTSLFRCLGKNITSPAELLSIINNEIYANITHGLFVTMIAGIYDPEEKRITLANAGHQPPIHVSEKQNITILETSSPPLGVVANTRFEEYNISLNNGSFYAFTDGLTEFEQQPGQPSGEDGVKQAIIHFSSTPAADRLKKIISQITNRNLDSPGHLMDDITMLLIDGNNLN